MFLKDRYTIIDNFDKLDLSYTVDELFGGDHPTIYSQSELEWTSNAMAIAGGIMRPETWDEMIFPVFSFNADATIPIGNYKVPYNFSKSLSYLPDMLRYITQRKFFIDYRTLELKYPSDNPDFGYDYEWFPYIQTSPLWNSPAGDFSGRQAYAIQGAAYWLDVLSIVDIFDRNNLVFENSLRMNDYFEPDLSKNTQGNLGAIGAVAIPEYLHNIIPLDKVKEALNLLKENSSVFGEYKDSDFSEIYSLEFEDMMSYRYKSLFNFIAGGQSPDLKVFTGMLPGRNTKEAQGFYDLLYHPTFWADVDNDGDMDVNIAVRSALHKLLLMKKNINLPMFDPIGNFKLTSTNASRHLYFVTDLKKALSKKEIPPEIKNHNVVLVEPEYNYYLADAEMESLGEKSELSLPNLYTYYSLSQKKSDYYKQLVSLNENIKFNEDKISVKKYYQMSLQAPASFLLSEQESGVSYRYKNIMIDDKQFINQANTTAKLFPMYNKVSIPSSQSGFMDILSKHKLTDELVTLLGSYFTSVRMPESSMHKFAIHNGEANSLAKLSLAYLQILNLSDFFNANKVGHYEKYFYDSKGVKFGFKDEKKPAGPFSDVIGNKALSFYAIKNEILQYINDRKLTANETYMGKKCHSEVLAYEIAKFKTIDGERHHIQSVFLPSTSDGKDITYFDTQVIYGREYVYEVFTHSLVVGNRYFQERQDPEKFGGLGGTNKILNTKLPTPGEDYDHVTVKLPQVDQVMNDAVPIIIRAPYYNNRSLLNNSEQEQTTILDKPPLPPDIIFRPYKDDKNKILVSLKLNYGELKMTPFVVFEEDKEKIKMYYEAQGISTGLPLLYKTDDARGKYLIYRTSNKPTTWKDFANAKITPLSSDFSTGYNDIVMPNVDYYYFARFEDVHGNISNPTPIFHVRIVKEGGFPPYLISKIHTFFSGIPDSEKIKYEKSFKKYIKIKLADGTRKVTQGGLGQESTSIEYKKIGSTYNELKKYKIRIISKTTGKKIDINLDFAKKIDKNYLNKELVKESKMSLGQFIAKSQQYTDQANNEKKLTEAVKKAVQEDKSPVDGFFPDMNKPKGGW